MKKKNWLNLLLITVIILLIVYIVILLSNNTITNNKEFICVKEKQHYICESENTSVVSTINDDNIKNLIDDSVYRFETLIKLLEPIEDKKEWFISYKLLIKQNKDLIEIPKTIYDEFSEEEIYLIQRVVETETYQRSFECKANIASVVLNRFYSGKFGNTITKVVTSPHQFAYRRENITEDTILAVEYAFEIGDTTQGALFFHSFKGKEEPRKTFCGANYIFSDDAIHHFYK